MFGLFGQVALMTGLLIDAVILIAGLRSGESSLLGRGGAARKDAVRIARHPVLHAAITLMATLFVTYLSAAILLRPWAMDWGTTRPERQMSLPGDGLAPDANFRMDHAVTINARVDSVWPWLAQIGQDRAGFYSYDQLERFAGADIRNADRVHPEWQSRHEGELVRAAQRDYLGGRFGSEIGWRIAELQEGRAIVLRGWGTFAVRPVSANATRLHIRLRGDGIPSAVGSFLAPLFS